MQQPRQLTVLAASKYAVRTESYLGRQHLVVPVIALVEGVIQAMNAPNPELVTAEEFTNKPGGWNGRPLFYGHPVSSDGEPLSGNTPTTLEDGCIGIVFNSAVKKSKLTMEAWIDVAAAEDKAPALLKRVRKGDPIEISVGIFCDTDDTVTGEYEGKKYAGTWTDIIPDHLALLPSDDTGACSIEMGCGVRAAKEPIMSVKPTGVLTRFLQMFRAAQPASEMSDGDLRKKLGEALREAGVKNFNYVEAFVPVKDPNRVVYSCYMPTIAYDSYGGVYQLFERSFTLGDNGIVTLGDSEIEVEPVVYYEPLLMSEEVITAAAGVDAAAAGKRNSAKDQVKIQSMHDHAVALGAGCDYKAASRNAEAGAPCSCHQQEAPTSATNKEKNMTKEQIAKFLETATEEQVKAMSAAAEGKTPEAPKVVETVAPVVTPPIAPVVASEVKTPTFDDVLASASPEMRDAINEGARLGREKKAATIKALKDTGRCSFSDESLGKMTQAELDQLVGLAGTNVRAAVDFSVNGPKDTARAAADADTIEAAPDLGEAIRAAKK